MSNWKIVGSANRAELTSFISKLLADKELEHMLDWEAIVTDFEYRLQRQSRSNNSEWLLDVDYYTEEYAFRLKVEFDHIMRDNELTMVVREVRYRGNISDLSAVNTIWTLST